MIFGFKVSIVNIWINRISCYHHAYKLAYLNMVQTIEKNQRQAYNRNPAFH